MASRRKKRNTEDIDPLGGFSMEALFGLDPVTEVEKSKSIIGLPFRVAGGLIKAPIKIVIALLALPFKLLKAILPPYGSTKGDAASD